MYWDLRIERDRPVNQARVGHNEGIRLERGNLMERLIKSIDAAHVRNDVEHSKELTAMLMGIGDTGGKVLTAKAIAPHAQRPARNTGIDGIGAIVNCHAQVL